MLREILLAMTDPSKPQAGTANQPAENEQNTKVNKGPTGKKSGLLIVILLFLALVIFSRHEAINTIKCTPEIIAQKPDVIMLGAWWCKYCYQAKEYFQRNNIHYCEYDMENTATGIQLYQKHGGGLPVLLIGKYQLNGFDEQRLETALSLLEK
ncbi:MAG: hypothetical protein LJE83_00410 [Gammaproteobacteria bacterium]|nr:hypothetical protein [Gammaproteobacteria bacterium]